MSSFKVSVTCRVQHAVFCIDRQLLLQQPYDWTWITPRTETVDMWEYLISTRYCCRLHAPALPRLAISELRPMSRPQPAPTALQYPCLRHMDATQNSSESVCISFVPIVPTVAVIISIFFFINSNQVRVEPCFAQIFLLGSIRPTIYRCPLPAPKLQSESFKFIRMGCQSLIAPMPAVFW